MSKTNLSRRKLQFVAETISARRGRCALYVYALVRVPGFDLLVAVGAHGIERKKEIGFVPNSQIAHCAGVHTNRNKKDLLL